MARRDEFSSETSHVTAALFQASTQNEESVAQMINLLDIQDSMPAARPFVTGQLRRPACGRVIRSSISAVAPGR
jgi:hypothetical protein